VLINDTGAHFIEKKLEALLNIYGVLRKYGLGYHPQTSSQVDISNHEIKAILRIMVARSRKDWADKLDDAVWAYHTAFKTPIGTTPFRLIYSKPCHLLVELEHIAYWAIKHFNFDLKSAGEKRLLWLNKLEEIHLDAYENSKIYKEIMKRCMTKSINRREF